MDGRRRTGNPVESDRAAGVLLGAAAGDALGAGYEFTGDPPPVPQMIGGGLGGWEPGEWTDDTQMAVCIAQAAANSGIDPLEVGNKFLGWIRSGPADVGIQTRSVLGSAASAADLAGIAAAYHASHPRNSAGNGSLMRTGPVALAHLGDDEKLASCAREISALTHADPLASEACVIWCIAIDRAIREARLDGAHDGVRLLPGDRREFWAARLGEAEHAPLRSFTPNGYVVTALQAAYAAVAQTPVPASQPCRHLQLALNAAVSIGDDTDTVAAIAGALLGARWGASAVPLRWRRLIHGWPGYDAADLVSLALRAVNGEDDDPDGWPSAASLMPYYRTRFAPAGLAVPLADDPGVIAGDVAGLTELTDPPDVVVSLCRVGRHDPPDGAEAHQIWLLDEPGPAHNPNLDFILHDLATQIASWRDQGRTVFVHCVRAESRTPTIAAAYLAHRFGLSGREALRRVQQSLPVAQPNTGFVEALARIWPDPETCHRPTTTAPSRPGDHE